MVEDVERQIYINSQVNGVRISEGFLDFDQLRSGFVTVSQFSRILNALLNIKLTDGQIALLTAKYGDVGQNLINYSDFCRGIRGMDMDKQYLASDRTENRLNTESEGALRGIITRLADLYEKKGFNVYQTFKNFDVHNIGRITESQFYRAFVLPEGFRERELALIVSKYRNKTDPNMINYINFCHDVTTIAGQIYGRDNTEKGEGRPEGVPGETEAVSSLIAKIRMKMQTNRIRGREFFGDFDKLRRGVVTKGQFKSVLYRLCGGELGLTEDQLESVARLYGGNEVNYRDFSEAVENVLMMPDLEKSPTWEAGTAPETSWRPRVLSAGEEESVGSVVERIWAAVRERRLGLGEYMRDYDMGVMSSGLVSRSRFGRCLHGFGIELTPEEADLLHRKYGDEDSRWIHYRSFLGDVEKWGGGEEAAPLGDRPRAEAGGSSDLDSLMERIKRVVYMRRIRIKEFFSEFDELRRGVVTRDQFRRLLSQLGFSKLGSMDLADDEFDFLASLYSAGDPRFVLWTKFADEVNRVFESARPLPAGSPRRLDDCNDRLVQESLANIKTKMAQRHLSLRPTFRDFDRLNSGHVTPSHFAQCLSLLDVPPPNLQALQMLFCDDRGFNYSDFLSSVEPITPPQYMYPGLVAATQQANLGKLPQDDSETNFNDTMACIRQSITERDVRLHEFMEKFDRLNHGVITKSEFRRSLDSLNIRLSPNQLSTIFKHFQDPASPAKVNYRDFCQNTQYGVETDFLEKCPLASPPTLSAVSPQEGVGDDDSLLEMSRWVRERRVDIFPLFKDFDPSHSGVVSRSQFLRCLSCLGVMSLLGDQSRVCRMFAKCVGGLQGVDYVSFCRRVDAN